MRVAVDYAGALSETWRKSDFVQINAFSGPLASSRRVLRPRLLRQVNGHLEERIQACVVAACQHREVVLLQGWVATLPSGFLRL